MVWWGVVWCDVVWRGVAWRGMALRGVASYGPPATRASCGEKPPSLSPAVIGPVRLNRACGRAAHLRLDDEPRRCVGGATSGAADKGSMEWHACMSGGAHTMTPPHTSTDRRECSCGCSRNPHPTMRALPSRLLLTRLVCVSCSHSLIVYAPSARTPHPHLLLGSTRRRVLRLVVKHETRHCVLELG